MLMDDGRRRRRRKRKRRWEHDEKEEKGTQRLPILKQIPNPREGWEKQQEMNPLTLEVLKLIAL